MKLKLTLLFSIFLLSCKQQLTTDDVNALFNPTIEMLEEDSHRITRNLRKGVEDGGNKPAEKAIVDSIQLFDSLFNRYKNFIQSEQAISNDLLTVNFVETLSDFKTALHSEHFAMLRQVLDSSEFFNVQPDRVGLNYEQVSDRDFLLYKKYLCMDWLLLSMKFKKKYSENKLQDANPLALYYPTLSGDKNTVGPGDTLRLRLQGYEYYGKDLTFMVDGKPVDAKNGIANIKIKAKTDRGEKLSRKKMTLSVRLPIWDRDTTFTSTVGYEVEASK